MILFSSCILEIGYEELSMIEVLTLSRLKDDCFKLNMLLKLSR